MKPSDNVFIGIDLGTSNSSISYVIKRPNGSLQPVVISIEQLVPGGGIRWKELLPSVIYFKNGKPIIGEYAKDMLRSHPNETVRSVKLEMGREKTYVIHDEQYTPTLISSYILKYLKYQAEKRIGRKITDVVIGVPASFDADMRKATLKAAELAGFHVKNEHGDFLDILLDEPRATLFDIINKQLNNELSTSYFEYGKEKTVLVYDLGGGTLDVSIHSITPQRNGSVRLKDIAISRYTDLGGDTFDHYIASYYLEVFKQRNPDLNLKSISQLEYNELWNKLLIAAEDTKKQLTTESFATPDSDNWWDITLDSSSPNPQITINTTNDTLPQVITHEGNQGQLHDPVSLTTITGNPSVTITTGFLIRDRMFSIDISLAEYEQIVSPLLGNHLELHDYTTIHAFSGINRKNLVFPILDVFAKAKKKLKKEPKIDMVIFSGGMTKFPLVKARIQSLLGIEPIAITDPDTSVSRGAAIYHYLKAKGQQFSTILAETISLGIKNNKIFPLVHAGTVLPYNATINHDFIIPVDNTTKLKIPLYRGESLDPQENTLVKGVIFNLERPYPKGTIVKANIKIDQNKTIEFKAWLKDNPTQSITVITDTTSTAPQSSKNKIQPINKTLPTPTKPLNITMVINKYKNHVKKNNEKGMKTVETMIMNAQNSAEFIPALLKFYEKKINRNRLLEKRFSILIAKLCHKHIDTPYLPIIKQLLVKNVTPRINDYELDYKTRIFGALIGIGVLQVHEAEEVLIDLTSTPYISSISQPLLITLGKIGHTSRAVETTRLFITSQKLGERISAIWTLGKLASKKTPRQIPKQAFIPEINTLFKNLKTYLQKPHPNHNLGRNTIYALGEILDNRKDDNPIPKIHATQAIKVLDIFITRILPQQFVLTEQTNVKLRERYYLKQLAIAVKQMILGIELEEEQEAMLLEIRNQ